MRISINGSALLLTHDVDKVVDAAAEAADHGMAGFWLAQVGGVDALTALALAAGRAPGIELGTAVIPIWFRHPSALASQSITVNAATGGRLVVGIGLAHKPTMEDGFDIAFEKPVRYMREHLDVLLPLLTDGKADATGQLLSGRVEVALPDCDPPSVMIAAMGEQMLRLTGRRADGTILWLTGDKTIESHIAPTITKAAAEAGRAEPRILASLPVGVTDDPDGLRDFAAQVFAGYNDLPSYRAMMDIEGADGPGDLCIFGDEAHVQSRLESFASAGTTDFAVVEFGDEATQRRTRDLLRSML